MVKVIATLEERDWNLIITKTMIIMIAIILSTMVICDYKISEAEYREPQIVNLHSIAVKVPEARSTETLTVLSLSDVYYEAEDLVALANISEKEVNELEAIEMLGAEDVLVPIVDAAFISAQNEVYYNPTDEERKWAYLVAFSEAGNQDALGQIYVINCAINHMKHEGYENLIDEFTYKNRYSSVRNGVPSYYSDGWKAVSEDLLTDELKEAVDMAFEKDYTEEILKPIAEALGLGEEYYKGGAEFFYSPKYISDSARSERAKIKVKFTYGGHTFYKFWDR